jgi:hypothetical protein
MMVTVEGSIGISRPGSGQMTRTPRFHSLYPYTVKYMKRRHPFGRDGGTYDCPFYTICQMICSYADGSDISA